MNNHLKFMFYTQNSLYLTEIPEFSANGLSR